MADGFLGRWSRRKADVREGREVAPEPTVAPVEVPAPSVPGAAAPVEPAAPEPVAVDEPPPPTLEDVKALTPDADFTVIAVGDGLIVQVPEPLDEL